MTSRRSAVIWFAAWLVIGAAVGFGVIGLLTIGLPLLAIAGGATAWLLVRRPQSRIGMWGLLSGGAAAAGFLAWNNRGGPGDVCHVTSTETSCQQEWSPLPFVAIGALMLVVGVVLFAIQTRDRRTE